MAATRLSFPRRDPAGLERLRDRIRSLEGTAEQLDGGEEAHGRVFRFGDPDIDGFLPWNGLPKGALHEVVAEESGAATSFGAALIGRLSAGRGDRSKPRPVLWCESGHVLDAGGIYVPGLARFGLDPERLILVRARRDEDALWAMEEGLRCGSLDAVLGELESISLTAGRRLQLAAAASGGNGIPADPPHAGPFGQRRDDALAGWRHRGPGNQRARAGTDMLGCGVVSLSRRGPADMDHGMVR